MRAGLIVSLSAALLAGCATHRTAASAAGAGKVFVARACAGCHAVAGLGPSPNPRAPTFLSLARERSDAELGQALNDISRNGHVEMPPIYITPDEQRAVAAYLRSLTGRAT